VIVVINKIREAPFFKATDYGIVGDAFELCQNDRSHKENKA
jgi:electron transfer flavoprotein alpha subunit